MDVSTTSIRVSAQVKRTLESMKLDPRETLNDVVGRLLEDILELNKATLAHVEAARTEIRAGRYVTQEQIRQVLGV